MHTIRNTNNYVRVICSQKTACKVRSYTLVSQSLRLFFGRYCFSSESNLLKSINMYEYTCTKYVTYRIAALTQYSTVLTQCRT